MVEAARARYRSGAGATTRCSSVEAERARMLADEVAYGAEARAARARLDALRGLAAGPPPTRSRTCRCRACPRVPRTWRRGRRESIRACVRRPATRPRGAGAPLDATHGVARAHRRASYGFRQTLRTACRRTTCGARGRRHAADRRRLARGRRGGRDDRHGRRGGVRDRADGVARRRTGWAARCRYDAARRTVTLLADTVVARSDRALAASWSAYDAGAPTWPACSMRARHYTEEHASRAPARTWRAHSPDWSRSPAPRPVRRARARSARCRDHSPRWTARSMRAPKGTHDAAPPCPARTRRRPVPAP